MRVLLLFVLIWPAVAQVNPDNERAVLLNPTALASSAKRAPETEQELRRNFADPPAEYRSMPLWVWNDELEWPRLAEQLGQFKQQGIGGVFIHPRPGLMTEYLGGTWFKLWGLAIEEGKRLGLSVNIYDENSYPSGFAGGHVPSRAPDTAAQFVQAQIETDAARISWDPAQTVAVFAIRRGPDGRTETARRIRSRAELAAGEAAVVFRLARASGLPWTGGFPYTDLTNPQTAPLFLETTYEAYRERFGPELGKTIRWAFTDEPLLQNGGPNSLPLSFNTLAEFRKRCGYDLADRLVSLFWDLGDFRKVRFDYWQTVHDLWKENFFRPMFLWCDRNNLQFTGHWMEHEWPYPWITPADASFYAYEHVPGIDMLEGANLRTRGADPHMLFTIRRVASVSHQLGRRAFCEAYGVAGWDSTFEHYKRFGDWLMVHGIDFMDQHLAFATVRGARKRDHPQSFSDVSPWWRYYRLHGDHLGRVSYMLSRGRSRNRLLVLEPTTSGFLWARRGERTPELEKMRQENAGRIQFLADRQVDFDLADEYILEWFGRVEGGKLVVGRAAYDLLVWPENMINVRRQTVPLLEQYLAAGGEILALAAPASYVDGAESEQVKALARRYAAQWHSVSGLPELYREVARRLPPRVKFDAELPPGVGFSERFLDNGDRIVFFANTGLKPVQARATVEGAGLEEWDSVTGEISAASFETGGPGQVKFVLELPPAGLRLFLVKKSPVAPKATPRTDFAPLEVRDWRITPDAPNVLVLDYCDLAVAGAEYRDVNTWRANWILWQAHGFERPAWDNAVQFKTRIFDRNRFAPDSGFVATFRFEIADAAAARGLELAMETPELFKATLNGSPVDFKPGARWLDPHLVSVPVGRLAKAGENVVRIAGRPFDVRMELENIYVRGAFSATPGENGFRLAAPAKLGFGSWAKQGYPFYGDSVVYEADVEVPAGDNRLRVELGAFEASVVEVRLDGKQVAVLGWPPYAAEFAAAPGRHAVALRVVSTPRNIFGPFHNPTRPRMRAWPAAWAAFPERQPAGSQYDVLDYGLTAPPVVSAGHRLFQDFPPGRVADRAGLCRVGTPASRERLMVR